jgi:uncharacterized protein (DUF58 family)
LGSLGSAAAAAGLCGLFLHPQGFVVFFGILAVTALGLVWPWLSVIGLSASLVIDRSRCREGESVATRIVLRNTMPWAAWGLSVRGGIHDGDGDSHAGIPLVGLAVLGGWRTVAETVEFVPGLRGEYPRRPPRVVCGFPFGLWEAWRPLEVTSTLLVWPRTVPVAAVPESKGEQVWDGLATRDRAGHWGDPLGVRPYRRGDPLRQVHWSLTARHGQLIVREVQSNAVPRVLIVLDVNPAVHAGSGPDSSLEWAIRVAASFAEGWIGQGAEVELVFDGASAYPRGRSAQARSAAVLDALARLKSGSTRDQTRLLALIQSGRADHGHRVVVTTNRGLRELDLAGLPPSGSRFVVLQTEPFDHERAGGVAAPLPLVPWIEIDGPLSVVSCLGRARKGVSLGR